jgi:hypothetical protein
MSTPPNSRGRNKSRNDIEWSDAQLPIIHTAGEVFADGASIDLVREAATGDLLLSSFDGDSCKIGARVEAHGSVYLPAKIHPTILRAVALPTTFSEYGSTLQLFAATREQFEIAGFPEDISLPAAHFVFASWFPESSAVAPCLSISGPHSEAMYLLRLLGCLVRHPLRLAEVTRAGLCSLPNNLQVTYLICQEPISRSTRTLLNASNNPGAHLSWKGGLANIYSPKAIYVGTGFAFRKDGDSSLHIHLTPSRSHLPILNANAQRMITDEFQGKMQAYRFRNINRVRDSQFNVPGLASGSRILSQTLGACIVDAPEIQAGLEPLLQDQEEQARASRWTDLECVAIEAALYHSHVEMAGRTYIGKLTKTAHEILVFRGEKTPLSPEEIGRVLRRLGLVPRRDSSGSALVFTDQMRKRIHELARDYGVAAAQQGIAMCPLCSEILPAFGSEASSRWT